MTAVLKNSGPFIWRAWDPRCVVPYPYAGALVDLLTAQLILLVGGEHVVCVSSYVVWASVFLHLTVVLSGRISRGDEGGMKTKTGLPVTYFFSFLHLQSWCLPSFLSGKGDRRFFPASTMIYLIAFVCSGHSMREGPIRVTAPKFERTSPNAKRLRGYSATIA